MKKLLVFVISICLIFLAIQLEAQKKKKTKNTKTTEVSNTQTNISTSQPEQSTTYTVNANLVNDNSLRVVESKGVGLKRDDALQDALRNAVGQAAGVAISSETSMENFVVIKDAVSAKTEGYVASYTVLKEVPFPDRYEISIQAKVSLNPLKADMQLLSKAIGGVRFLAMYDARKLNTEEKQNYEFAVERINEFLAERKYRYIEKERSNALLKEAQGIFQSEGQQESYVQHIGMKADAQFVIFISKISVSSRSEAFDTRTANKVIIEAKVYDNCTAEGLGTIALESDWKSGMDRQSVMYEGIREAVNKGMTKLLFLFNSYIGGWVNNGTPFELRFYSIGTFRDFRTLRDKLLNDGRFGGNIEITSFENYTRLNLTFRDRPDELAYKILDFADAIPEFKSKVLDVKLIYGRQINFAPQKAKIPELENIKK